MINAFKRKLATVIQTLEKCGASGLHVWTVLALDQGCTYTRRQVAVATNRFRMSPNICRFFISSSDSNCLKTNSSNSTTTTTTTTIITTTTTTTTTTTNNNNINN
jgi:hypothetical protein